MSEITKACKTCWVCDACGGSMKANCGCCDCEQCDGTGTSLAYDEAPYPEPGCKVCSGTGRVPDIEGSLRAEVEKLTYDVGVMKALGEAFIEEIARLTTDRDMWKAAAQREPSDNPGIMDTLNAFYYQAAQEGTRNGLLWMLAADCGIQGTYARFYQMHPEHQRDYHTYSNARAAALNLMSAVKAVADASKLDRLTKLVRSAEMMLQIGQFDGRGPYWQGPCCPECGGSRATGHREGCDRAKWLKEYDAWNEEADGAALRRG
jgi:hypothetical protein